MVALKFCNILPKRAIEARRRSPTDIVLEAIGHQISLLKDSSYTVERQRYQKTDGGYKRVASSKPPRKWWFQGDDGAWYVQVHLGTKVVALDANKPTLACGKTEKDIIPVLEQVAALVKEGKFADAIADTHTALSRKKAG